MLIGPFGSQMKLDHHLAEACEKMEMAKAAKVPSEQISDDRTWGWRLRFRRWLWSYVSIYADRLSHYARGQLPGASSLKVIR